MKRTLYALVLSTLIHGGLFYIPTPPLESQIAPSPGPRPIPIRFVQAKVTSAKVVLKAARPTPATLENRSRTRTHPLKTTPSPKPLSTPLPTSAPTGQATEPLAKAQPEPLEPSPAPPSVVSLHLEPQAEPAEKTAPSTPLLAPPLVHVEEKPTAEALQRTFRELKGGYQVMPVYPLAARREQREGDVLLKVEVLENGLIGEITVARSSQSADLDAAAIDAVKQWRFEPAIRNGQAIQQVTLLPIRFDLRSN